MTKFLAGQGAILVGHFPLTGRYFEPKVPSRIALEK